MKQNFLITPGCSGESEALSLISFLLFAFWTRPFPSGVYSGVRSLAVCWFPDYEPETVAKRYFEFPHGQSWTAGAQISTTLPRTPQDDSVLIPSLDSQPIAKSTTMTEAGP